MNNEFILVSTGTGTLIHTLIPIGLTLVTFSRKRQLVITHTTIRTVAGCSGLAKFSTANPNTRPDENISSFPSVYNKLWGRYQTRKCQQDKNVFFHLIHCSKPASVSTSHHTHVHYTDDNRLDVRSFIR